MRKIILYGTILMACVFMLVAGVLPLKATKINQRKLLVLGDSVASGYGLTDDEDEITDDISWAALLAQKYVAELCNYAVDDYTTSDLLADVKKPSRQEMISSSDVICISIGGNNFIQLFYGNVDKSITKTGLDTAMVAMIEAASEDLDGIFTLLKEKNPEALVMVQTLYNPFMYCNTSASQYISGYQGTVGALVEEYIDDYNQMLKQKTQEHGFTCVEVAQKFQMEGNTTWLNTQTDSLDLVFSSLNRIEGASASVTGITVTPSRNGASFSVKTNTDSQGQKYKAIENITRSGWAKLKVSATGSRYSWQTSAGLSPNTSYTVTLNIECEGKEAELVLYEASDGNEFYIRVPRGEISFVVTTDKYGAFTKEWDTIYVTAGVSSSVKFTDVTLTKNIDLELQPTEEGHYAIYEAYLDAGMDEELKDKLGILMDISEYRCGDTYTYPSMEGYVFAGWYQDSQFTRPISTTMTTGNAYAKFVDDAVLSVKYQLTADTLAISENTDLRILTTVDSLQYGSVGFTIGLENRGNMTYTTRTVYETIYGYADSQRVAYQPKVFSPLSEYFISYTIQGVTGEFFASEFTVEPFWTTLDGTIVTSESRTFAVHDELSKEKTVNVNYRDVICLAEYFEEDDNFSNAKLYSTTGKQISLGGGSFYADTMGTYTLVLPESMYTYKFVVKDIEGPVVMLNNQKMVVGQGETVIIRPRVVDNVDGEMDVRLDNLSYTVKKNGQEVSVQNHSFKAEELGDYVIEFAIQDMAGNQAAPITIQCVTAESVSKSVYRTGVTIKADGSGITRLEKEFTEGKNAGKTYTSLESSAPGNVNFSIIVTHERGLKPNTKYRAIVDVATDGSFPAFIGPDDCFIISSPGGTIAFDITTDEDGEFTQTYNGAYLQQATYVDFTGITFKEIKGSVYGTGVTITADGSGITRVEKENAEVNDAVVTYTSLESSAPGNVNFSIIVTHERGLKANTKYHVTVDVATDGQRPAFIGPSDCFIISSPGGIIDFDIITDGNGEFAQTYNGAYLQNATYVDFTGITFTEIKESVYGAGITITADGSGITRMEKTFTEGENAGKIYTSLASSAPGPVNFSIIATNERGLKANTKYHVTVDVATDGPFPAFIGPSDCFIIGTPGGIIEFDIITDGNGEFAQTYNGAYLQQATYLDFTGVTMIEK